jgi:hypothetical protein|tara:strand:- start:310 stop:576 length:267 start_codon:yes stop_codon:yes gene_type:complete
MSSNENAGGGIKVLSFLIPLFRVNPIFGLERRKTCCKQTGRESSVVGFWDWSSDIYNLNGSSCKYCWILLLIINTPVYNINKQILVVL